MPLQENTPSLPPEKRGIGCFGIGCIVLIVIGLLVASVVGFGVWKAYDWAKSFTADTAAQIVALEPAAGEYEAVIRKVDEFEKAVDAGLVPSMSLSEREFAILLAGAPEDADIRRMVTYGFFPEQSGDPLVFMDTSLPLDEVPLMKGRFFNAKVILRMVNSPTGIQIFPEKVLVAGNELPKDIMDELASQDMAKDLISDNSRLAPLLLRTASVEFAGDNLVFKGKTEMPTLEQATPVIEDSATLEAPPTENNP